METFAFAGVSKYKGSFKVRFANDQLRVKHLAKVGHSDIDIIQLKNPMTKADAVAYLLSIDFDNGNKEVRACLEAAQDRRAPKQPKVKEPKAAKEPKAKAKPTLDSIKAKAKKAKEVKTEVTAEVPEVKVDLKDIEDAPF